MSPDRDLDYYNCIDEQLIDGAQLKKGKKVRKRQSVLVKSTHTDFYPNKF